jgi:GT2 family glycosyltransferase
MSTQPPTFSVVVPTCGRPHGLRTCLTALGRLDYPRACFEVIVVDDGGGVGADEVVDEFRQHLDLTLVKQANAGPAAARNAGAQRASHEFLAFVDDDCRPAPGWLAAFASRFSKTPGHVLGGRVENGVVNNRFSAASQMILDVVYRHYNADPEQARFFVSANVAMAASVFREVGAFDTRFRTASSEDREFCDRARFRGYPMAYVADAVVSHDRELNFLRFCRQHFNYGRGACDFHEARAERGSGTLRREMTFHLNARNWFFYPFTQVGWREALPLAANLALWQLTYSAGFLGESLQRKLGRRG